MFPKVLVFDRGFDYRMNWIDDLVCQLDLIAMLTSGSFAPGFMVYYLKCYLNIILEELTLGPHRFQLLSIASTHVN